MDTEVLRGTNNKEKIRVVNLNGVIQSDSNSEFVIDQLKSCGEDPYYKRVILL